MTGLKKADGKRVVIIGGGVIGCLTALYLRRLGASPIVLEKGRTCGSGVWRELLSCSVCGKMEK